MVPEFWSDPESSKTVLQKKARFVKAIESFQKLVNGYDDAQTMFDLAKTARH